MFEMNQGHAYVRSEGVLKTDELCPPATQLTRSPVRMRTANIDAQFRVQLYCYRSWQLYFSPRISASLCMTFSIGYRPLCAWVLVASLPAIWSARPCSAQFERTAAEVSPFPAPPMPAKTTSEAIDALVGQASPEAAPDAPSREQQLLRARQFRLDRPAAYRGRGSKLSDRRVAAKVRGTR